MQKALTGVIIFLLSFMSVTAFADFRDLTEDQKFELYNESCEKEQFASCYQVGHWYLKNKRQNPKEIRKLQEELSPLADELHGIQADNKLRNESERVTLPLEKIQRYKELQSILSEEQQAAISQKAAMEALKKACDGGEKVACKELSGKINYEGASFLYWTALILIGLAVFLISKTIFQDEDTFQAQEKLEDSRAQNDDIAKHGFILRYSRPFFKRYFSPIVSGMKNKKRFKEKYRRKLAAAGLTNILTPEDFFAFKLFLIIGFPILFMVIRTFIEETWSLQLIPVLACIGFFYPDFWISGKITNRQGQIIRSMPFGVDMLALSVEAGLDFVAAMAKVIEKAKSNPLTEEFEIVIREIKIGASRAEALRNMAWRIDLIQISSFCATLIAADSVGASIGPILKSLAVEIRQKKSAEVEKAGATAATKILFPMLFLIVPSVLMIVFAPIVLEMIGGK
ncbi:MAG: type II secretion system F family protein [Bacteriovorax sp.]|nr:type II secretion system F family protein [Bacteriovorax sp.]